MFARGGVIFLTLKGDKPQHNTIMKNRPTIKLFFLSVFSLFLSCEEEQLFNAPEQRSEIQLTAVQIFQSTFDLDKFEDPAEQIVGNIEIDWNDFTIKTLKISNGTSFKSTRTSL